MYDQKAKELVNKFQQGEPYCLSLEEAKDCVKILLKERKLFLDKLHNDEVIDAMKLGELTIEIMYLKTAVKNL